MKRWKGHIVALLVIMVWGTTFVSSKVLLNHGLSPEEIFFCRFVIAYMSLLVFSHKEMFTRSIRDELIMAGLGIMGGSLYFLAENYALTYNTSSNVSILVGSTPLITALLVGMVKREQRQTVLQSFGSIMAFIGMGLVVLNGQLVLHLNPLGDILALGAAFTWALYSLLMTFVSGRYPAVMITRKVFFYGLVTILPFLFCKGTTHTFEHLSSPIVLGNILFLGLIASTLGYILWNWALNRIGAILVTNYVYLQSFVTLIAASLILDEHITPMAIAGCLILILGMIIASRKDEPHK